MLDDSFVFLPCLWPITRELIVVMRSCIGCGWDGRRRGRLGGVYARAYSWQGVDC